MVHGLETIEALNYAREVQRENEAMEAEKEKDRQIKRMTTIRSILPMADLSRLTTSLGHHNLENLMITGDRLYATDARIVIEVQLDQSFGSEPILLPASTLYFAIKTLKTLRSHKSRLALEVYDGEFLIVCESMRCGNWERELCIDWIPAKGKFPDLKDSFVRQSDTQTVRIRVCPRYLKELGLVAEKLGADSIDLEIDINDADRMHFKGNQNDSFRGVLMLVSPDFNEPGCRITDAK